MVPHDSKSDLPLEVVNCKKMYILTHVSFFNTLGLILSAEPLFNYNFVKQCHGKTEDIMKSSQNLLEIVSTMEPKSARFLRKIPFQALMKVPELPAQLSDFLVALRDCCN